MIDDFTTSQALLLATSGTPVVSSSQTTGSDDIIGSERDLEVRLLAGSLATAEVSSDGFSFGTGSGSQGEVYVIYDGSDGLPGSANVNYTGLNSYDLTNKSTLCAFLLHLDSADGNGALTLTVYTDENNYSSKTVNVTDGEADLDIILPFGDTWDVTEGSGADFKDVGAIVFKITGDPAMDWTLDFFQATSTLTSTKDDALSIDNNNNNQANPGDVIEYTVTIENPDPANADEPDIDVAATGVVFTDTPDSNTTLVEITSTSQGTATIKDNGTDPSYVDWAVGDIADGASAYIKFTVRVNDPFPTGVDEVENQGVIETDKCYGDYSLLTDDLDPHSPDGPADPTNTPVFTSAPEIKATKIDNLQPGEFARPGETVTYTVEITNTGLNKAENVIFTDPFDADSSLVPGSVTTIPDATTAGYTITTNDTQIQVEIGDLKNNATVTIDFQVVVDDPFPDNKLVNQGSISATGFSNPVLTDGSTEDGIQETETDVKYPVIVATKADSPDPVGPGEIVTYTVELTNEGTADATNVEFTDDLGDYYSLVVPNAVTTDQGTVTTGNGANDTSIAVDVGDIAPGAANKVTIAYQVRVDDTVPLGVDQIENQGTVSYDKFGGTEEKRTDGTPQTTQGPPDPTITTINAAPVIIATKTDSPDPVGPGEIVTYTVEITNEGTTDASNVEFTDDLGDYYSLAVPNHVTTSKGTVTTGNGASDTSVLVDIGNIAPGAANKVTITFDVTVDNPFPAGVQQVISNQGTVSGDNFTPGLPTDDPATGGVKNDATVTQVDASPVVSATKTDNLTQAVSPGDTITYQVVIRNDGDTAATSVVFSDTPGDNCSLVPNTVATSQGSVTTGNGGSDTQVVVNVGDVDPGDANAVTITFNVIVDNPFPAGVPLNISNQGTVAGDNFDPDVSTDDPDNGTGDYNPTVTPIEAATKIGMQKTDSIGNDIDNDGIVDPGDTVSYSIIIENNGDMDAAGVIFTDPPVDNAKLVTGSVSTTQGTVIIGNGSNDTSVQVNVGTLAGNGGTVTVEFDVVVDDPIPAGVVQISNQGTVDGDNFDPVDTDDPSIGGTTDPTITPLTATPVVTATKVDELVNDADGDNFFGPGDTVRYTIVITNSGNTEATEVTLQDPAVANAALVIGTVTTSQGTVVEGNNSDDTAVEVNAGNIPADGGTVTVTFDVLIDDPLPAGITRISNQGTISGTNLGDPVVTDDPATPAQNDPTVSPILPVKAEKTAALQIDNNGNGVANPGDTIRYTIVIVNEGPADSTDTVFTDPEEEMENTALVPGSVVTSQGTVTSGNADGNVFVEVELGTLPANGGEATVYFDVVIDDPFPLAADSIDNQGNVQYVFNNQPVQVLTDEPGTAEPEDETVVAVEPAPAGIPTLSEIGALLLALVLTAAGLLVVRRKKYCL